MGAPITDRADSRISRMWRICSAVAESWGGAWATVAVSPSRANLVLRHLHHSTTTPTPSPNGGYSDLRSTGSYSRLPYKFWLKIGHTSYRTNHSCGFSFSTLRNDTIRRPLLLRHDHNTLCRSSRGRSSTYRELSFTREQPKNRYASLLRRWRTEADLKRGMV